MMCADLKTPTVLTWKKRAAKGRRREKRRLVGMFTVLKRHSPGFFFFVTDNAVHYKDSLVRG